MKKLFIALIFIPIIMCTSKEKNLNILNRQDTILKDIPLNSKGEYESFYLWGKKFDSVAHISNMDNGYDSLMIRIWYGNNYSSIISLLEIRNVNGIWSSQNDAYYYNQLNDTDSFSVRLIKHSIVVPESSFVNVINKLTNFDFFRLPHFANVNGYHYTEATGGEGVTIEWATKKRYRIYNYSNYRDIDIPEAKKMQKIVSYLENEFGIKMSDN